MHHLHNGVVDELLGADAWTVLAGLLHDLIPSGVKVKLDSFTASLFPKDEVNLLYEW